MKASRRRRKLGPAEGATIADLPESIAVDILSRLPAKSIFSCRRGCKTWSNLLSQTYFAELHHSRSPIQFLLQGHEKINKSNRLMLAEIDEDSCVKSDNSNYRAPKKSLINLNLQMLFPDPEVEIRIRCADNVTGCLVLQDVRMFWTPYHILNPLTRQHIVIEQTNKDPLLLLGCVLGFSSKTNQLKLIRFLFESYTSVVVADIQTIGTNLWRSTRRACPRDLSERRSAPFVNGLYHWINREENAIYSFDFEEEVFLSFPTPLFSDNNGEPCRVHIGSLEGNLCAIDILVSHFELWVMNEYGVKDSWTKKFVIHGGDRVNLPYLEFIVPLRYLKNGELLMVIDRHTVFGYNPHTRITRYINFYGGRVNKYLMVAYVPNFMMVPQTLGES